MNNSSFCLSERHSKEKNRIGSHMISSFCLHQKIAIHPLLAQNAIGRLSPIGLGAVVSPAYFLGSSTMPIIFAKYFGGLMILTQQPILISLFVSLISTSFFSRFFAVFAITGETGEYIAHSRSDICWPICQICYNTRMFPSIFAGNSFILCAGLVTH